MTDRLNQFTPNAAGLDRDAILFAAGQRAVRGSWVWKAAACMLAITQVATLIALWPRETPLAGPATSVPQMAPAIMPVSPESSPPPDVWTIHSSPDVVLDPPKSSLAEFAPSGPPLTAWAAHRFD